MIDPFVRKSSQVVLENRLFKLRHDRAVHPRSGQEGEYVVLEMADFVNVVALTPERHLVLVRQWRHGTRRVELEIPAGLVEAGESPEVAGARELAEETGYVPERVRVLGSVAPNSAFQQNRCTTLLAEGCRPTGQLAPDESEDIEVLTATPAEVRTWLRDGTIQNSLVLLGLYLWLESEGRISWP